MRWSQPCDYPGKNSRLGKPQVYGPGSDNSHDRVVKTAPKLGDGRMMAEKSLNRGLPVGQGCNVPHNTTREVPPTDTHAWEGEPTCREGVTGPESHSQKKLEPERECTQLGSGCWFLLPHSEWKQSPQHSEERPERPSPTAGTVYFGRHILKRNNIQKME